MKALRAGHQYELDERWPVDEGVPETYEKKQTLRFVNKEPGHEEPGTTTQEVIRVLLDRTRYCNNCLPHPNNERIIYHLRMALTLHEARALERKTEKGLIDPEYISVGPDGHFEIPDSTENLGEETDTLMPYRHDWDRECTYDVKKETKS